MFNVKVVGNDGFARVWLEVKENEVESEVAALVDEWGGEDLMKEKGLKVVVEKVPAHWC